MSIFVNAFFLTLILATTAPVQSQYLPTYSTQNNQMCFNWDLSAGFAYSYAVNVSSPGLYTLSFSPSSLPPISVQTTTQIFVSQSNSSVFPILFAFNILANNYNLSPLYPLFNSGVQQYLTVTLSSSGSSSTVNLNTCSLTLSFSPPHTFTTQGIPSSNLNTIASISFYLRLNTASVGVYGTIAQLDSSVCSELSSLLSLPSPSYLFCSYLTSDPSSSSTVAGSVITAVTFQLFPDINDYGAAAMSQMMTQYQTIVTTVYQAGNVAPQSGRSTSFQNTFRFGYVPTSLFESCVEPGCGPVQNVFQQQQSSSGLTNAQIAGIVIGCVIGGPLLIALLVLFISNSDCDCFCDCCRCLGSCLCAPCNWCCALIDRRKEAAAEEERRKERQQREYDDIKRKAETEMKRYTFNNNDNNNHNNLERQSTPPSVYYPPRTEGGVSSPEGLPPPYIDASSSSSSSSSSANPAPEGTGHWSYAEPEKHGPTGATVIQYG